jgi:hypothetical protein
MEPNWNQQNNKLFIVGMIFLVLSLMLLAYTMYLSPYLLLNWKYDVPESVVSLQNILSVKWETTERTASVVMFLVLVAVSGALIWIAHKLSNRMEHTENPTEQSEPERDYKRTKETMSVLAKLVVWIVVIFVAALVLQWIMYTPPPVY